MCVSVVIPKTTSWSTSQCLCSIQQLLTDLASRLRKHGVCADQTRYADHATGRSSPSLEDLRLDVYDKDSISSDNFLGMFMIPASDIIDIGAETGDPAGRYKKWLPLTTEGELLVSATCSLASQRLENGDGDGILPSFESFL